MTRTAAGDVRVQPADAVLRKYDQVSSGVSHLCTLSSTTWLSAGFNRSIYLWDARQPKNIKLLQDAIRCKLTAIDKFSQDTFLTASEDGLVNVSVYC